MVGSVMRPGRLQITMASEKGLPLKCRPKAQETAANVRSPKITISEDIVPLMDVMQPPNVYRLILIMSIRRKAKKLCLQEAKPVVTEKEDVPC